LQLLQVSGTGWRGRLPRTERRGEYMAKFRPRKATGVHTSTSRSVLASLGRTAKYPPDSRGGLPHADQDDRHPDPGILAAFALRIDLNAVAGGQRMKAVVYTRYGGPDVLRLTDADTPAPGDRQVLVKVHAVSLNASDWEMLRGKPLYARIGGPFRPRHHILGSDIAGRVATTGRTATRFCRS